MNKIAVYILMICFIAACKESNLQVKHKVIEDTIQQTSIYLNEQIKYDIKFNTKTEKLFYFASIKYFDTIRIVNEVHFYNNGLLKSIENSCGNRPIGYSCSYYENGKMKKLYYYFNNSFCIGTFPEFPRYETNTLVFQPSDNGILNGSQYDFYNDGRIKKKSLFYMNKLLKEEFFSPEGRLQQKH